MSEMIHASMPGGIKLTPGYMIRVKNLNKEEGQIISKFTYPCVAYIVQSSYPESPVYIIFIFNPIEYFQFVIEFRLQLSNKYEIIVVMLCVMV